MDKYLVTKAIQKTFLRISLFFFLNHQKKAKKNLSETEGKNR